MAADCGLSSVPESALKTYLACDGQWQIDNGISCTGALVSVTETEIAGYSSLTPEQVDSLTEATLGLFVCVFTVLVLRKVL